MFTIQAQLHRIYEVPVNVHELCLFFADPQSFARNMPMLESVVPENGTWDLTRWRFVVKVPLVAPIGWDFLIHRHVVEERGEIFYTTPESVADHFDCVVHVRPNLFRPDVTDADVKLRIRMERNKASEIHPLAGWVGERWISQVVTDRMAKMATEFVMRGLAEISARVASREPLSLMPEAEVVSLGAEFVPPVDMTVPSFTDDNVTQLVDDLLAPVTPTASAPVEETDAMTADSAPIS